MLHPEGTRLHRFPQHRGITTSTLLYPPVGRCHVARLTKYEWLSTDLGNGLNGFAVPRSFVLFPEMLGCSS